MMRFKAPPMGPGPRDGHVYLHDYGGKRWDGVPVAIPSRGRSDLLCQQTLTMLAKHNYDMRDVHVFVDSNSERKDGSNEYDRYYQELRASGFGMVNVHPGGKDLRSQYARVFQFFAGVTELILTTDMVPNIMVKRRPGSVEMQPLQNGMLATLIRVGFDVCRVTGARAWSLASCKEGMNLSAGAISLKCGLLCGNFCGVRMDVGPPPAMVTSNYTTDVEFSLRCWAECGCMVRFLGIAATHAYRSRGGLSMTAKSAQRRQEDTYKAIEKLSREFPTLIRTVRKGIRSKTRMNYRFCQRGPKPMQFHGTFETRGRKLTAGWRPLTVRQRVAKHRLMKRPARR